MITKIACWAIIFLLGLFGCAPWQSGSDQVANINYILNSDYKFSSLTRTQTDIIMNGLVSGQNKVAEGCALGLVRDGRVIYVKGYGYANKVPAILWDVRTVSAVGSVSKSFTALALLRLAELEDMDLENDYLNDYLNPKWLYGHQTLAAVLTHTSGIGGGTKPEASSPNWGPGPDVSAYPVDHPMAHPRYAYDAYGPYQVIVPLPNTTVNGFKKGVYSNVGYTLLGAVIDTITADNSFVQKHKAGYERFVWYEVARPSNAWTFALGHTWRIGGDIPKLAQGYKNGVPVSFWGISSSVEGWEGPSGGWTMTIGDLARFVAAVQNRKILSQGSWDAATQRRSWVTGVGPYGYGMWIRDIAQFPNGFELWHGGGITGYTALWASFERIGQFLPFGVAMQCNDDSAINAMERAKQSLFMNYIVGVP